MCGVVCLMALLLFKLGIEGSYSYRFEEDNTDAPQVEETVSNESFLEKVLDSVNIAVASQGFIIALFPIYSDMKREARPKMMVSIFGALTFTFASYSLLSFVSITYFGLDNIQQSIFENMKDSRDNFTLTLLAFFLIIFLCNIPFIFFAGKVCIISIVQMCMPS